VSAPRLYTIGYEGTPLPAFLRLLAAAQIDVVADVRELPLSRKRGFSKSALAAALAHEDIGYLHLRELGCPKLIRDRYRRDGDWERYTAAFMAHLATQRAAVAQLAEQAQGRRTALLCYEADFERCHRSYVARAASRIAGLAVRHITADGEVADRR
jgi:uncharacterized protein (DUF488 family)